MVIVFTPFSFVFCFSDDRAKKAKAENWLAQFNFSLPAAHANAVETADIQM
jgi:hypothetical protein